MSIDYKKHVVFIEKCMSPKGMKSLLIILLIILFCAFSGWLVYKTGGTKFVYAHTMYIPIILAAFFYRVKGGFFIGILGGMILGPYMPATVETGEMQLTMNWVYRLVFFVIIGSFSGLVFGFLAYLIQKFKWLSLHHSDTGLPNTTSFQREIDLIISGAKKDSRFAVLVFKINNFLEITNTFGVEIVDELILEIKNKLEKEYEVIQLFQLQLFFLGILYFGNDIGLEKWLLNFESGLKSVISIENIPAFIDISFGISYYPDHAQSSTQLLRKAMVAAHTAQNEGKTFQYYDVGIDKHSKEKVRLLGGLPVALSENQLFLNYQPIINLKNDELVGLEALARWTHPELGNIPPSDFIPDLENTTLINSFQTWVISNAINQRMNWNTHDFNGFLAINLSTQNFNYGRVLESILNTTNEFNLKPEEYLFEITETTLMTNPDKAFEFVNILHEEGFQIAIDDFGAGYSSLAYLKSLPVDYIKIDKQFIFNLIESKKDQQIVITILSMAKNLQISTLAEGVESQDTYKLLKMYGCDYAQGFHISRPLSVEKATEFIKDHG